MKTKTPSNDIYPLDVTLPGAALRIAWRLLTSDVSILVLLALFLLVAISLNA